MGSWLWSPSSVSATGASLISPPVPDSSADRIGRSELFFAISCRFISGYFFSEAENKTQVMLGSANWILPHSYQASTLQDQSSCPILLPEGCKQAFHQPDSVERRKERHWHGWGNGPQASEYSCHTIRGAEINIQQQLINPCKRHLFCVHTAHAHLAQHRSKRGSLGSPQDVSVQQLTATTSAVCKSLSRRANKLPAEQVQHTPEAGIGSLLCSSDGPWCLVPESHTPGVGSLGVWSLQDWERLWL